MGAAYSTGKQLVFYGNKILRSINIIWLFILLAIGFVVLWIDEKHYKTTTNLKSQLAIKVYDNVKCDFPREKFKPYVTDEEISMYNGVRDPTDYVKYIDSDNVFITTNMIQTIQSRGKCPEDTQFSFAICDPNNKHVKEECLRYLNKSDNLEGRGINGIPTGKCIETRTIDNTTVHTCEVEGWCPVMRRLALPLIDDEPLLGGTNESIVLFAASVDFFEFDLLERHKTINTNNCSFRDEECPKYRLGEIIRTTNIKKSYEDVFKYGAIIGLHIHWYCWQKWRLEWECTHTYKFSNLPNPEYFSPEEQNFIYEEKPHNNGRIFSKIYGITISVFVTGKAQKVDLLNFIIHFLSLAGIGGFLASGLIPFCIRCCYSKRKTSQVGDGINDDVTNVIINLLKSESLEKVLTLISQKERPMNHFQKSNEEMIPLVEISNDYLKRVNPYLINSIESKILSKIPLEYVNEIKGKLRSDLDAQTFNENLKQIITQYDSQIDIIANEVFMDREAKEEYPLDEIVEDASCSTICSKCLLVLRMCHIPLCNCYLTIYNILLGLRDCWTIGTTYIIGKINKFV